MSSSTRSPSVAAPATPLDEARTRVRDGFAALSRALEREGLPAIPVEGGLVRPVLAWLVATRHGAPVPPGFWGAAAAIQLAHEASLVHDDVIDGAEIRRGRLTVVAEHGAAHALLAGDALLTAAYALATRTGSPAFAASFATAVHRTVMGEVKQHGMRGRVPDRAAHERAVAGKSGELIGCAMAAAPLLRGEADAERWQALGIRLGVLYQRLDDLLDYLPGAGTGKPLLIDHARGQWTWPLGLLPDGALDLDTAEVARAFVTRDGAPVSPGRAALALWESELDALMDAAFAGPSPVRPVLLEWRATARNALDRAERVRTAGPRADRSVVHRHRDTTDWPRILPRHSRTFRFATRFFPAPERERVAAVYAWCRLTDDLVDGAGPLSRNSVERRLDTWLEGSRRAYDGFDVGDALLGRVMSDMAAARVPFTYAAELVEGVRMDLHAKPYETMQELRVYTHRVASVVGMWLTELFGVHEPWALERAALLGHAMQLTNILRDVGEDWDRGRLYLPRDVLARYGVALEDIAAWRAGAPIADRYRALLEELMRQADAAYEEAFAAIPALPAFARRPVGVAAHVYRGIHEAIRVNDYDNLTRRAYTSGTRKLSLAAAALLDLARMDRRPRERLHRRSPAAITAGGA